MPRTQRGAEKRQQRSTEEMCYFAAMEMVRRYVWGYVLLVCATGLGDWQSEHWNPFGGLPITGIGNLALGPNVIPWPYAQPMLHVGAVDLKQDAGTRVYTVREGVPSFPKQRPKESTLEGWTKTVQVRSDDGILTYYMHLDETSLPKALIHDIMTGRKIAAGTYLGTLVKHTTLPSHVHLGAADCRRHLRLDPWPVVEYGDVKPPVIKSILAHRAGSRNDLGATIAGAVELTTFAYDEIEGVPGKFALERLQLTITGPAGVVFDATVFDARAIPAHPSSDDHCEYFGDYDGYETQLGEAIYRDVEVFDAVHALPYALTGTTAKVPAHLQSWFHPFAGPWNTTKFPNGDYEITVRATDAKGNAASLKRVVRVANP